MMTTLTLCLSHCPNSFYDDNFILTESQAVHISFNDIICVIEDYSRKPYQQEIKELRDMMILNVSGGKEQNLKVSEQHKLLCIKYQTNILARICLDILYNTYEYYRNELLHPRIKDTIIGLVSDPYKKAEDKIRSAYIISLVQSLLTLSRLDADAITMKQEDVSVKELLEICSERTEILAELGDVSVIVQECGNISLNCDKKWMSEAITNILKNCIGISEQIVYNHHNKRQRQRHSRRRAAAYL